MRDSLFSGRNHYDPQIESADRLSCELLMEAATRRLVRVSGPEAAAGVIYRLGDVCAGANVVPLELLVDRAPKEAVVPPPIPPPKPVSRLGGAVAWLNHPVSWFYLGLFCGWLVFGR